MTGLSLDIAESKRIAAQEAFEGEESQDRRNKLGQFATPPSLAESMTRLARQLFPEILPVQFLDPGLGTGVFFSALLKLYGAGSIASATGFEADSRLAGIAKSLWSSFGLRVVCDDFTRAKPQMQEFDKPNLIICNPPYVRHHHLHPSLKESLKNRVASLGFAVNGLSGLYVYFLLLADKWLAANGAAIWIVPSEFLDVNYGDAVRRYLCNRVTTLRIHRFDPADVQFADALVTSTIVAFRNVSPDKDSMIHLTSGKDLLNPSFERNVYTGVLDPSEKWGGYFEHKITAAAPKYRLGDVFSIKRGLATGKNRFFILEASEAQRLVLPQQFLRPILPSPRFVPFDVIKRDTQGFAVGIPQLLLLDCALARTEIKKSFPSPDRYLEEGERQLIHELYLPNSRRPWYSQESRPPAPILCTYMARKKLRFVRNFSDATAHNVYLLLYPKRELAVAAERDLSILDRVFEYLHAVPNLQKIGRVYGGGLNKLEPQELANLALPTDLVEHIRGLAGECNAQREFSFI